jgi:hypothetical protein
MLYGTRSGRRTLLSRRNILGIAGALGGAVPLGLLKGANGFAGLGAGPGASTIGEIPICRASDTSVADPIGPPRHIRIAYNGTGICTAAAPVALHRGYFAKHNLLMCTGLCAALAARTKMFQDYAHTLAFRRLLEKRLEAIQAYGFTRERVHVDTLLP